MKKLMFALAAVAMASAASAATVSWGMSDAFASDSGLTTGKLYLFHRSGDEIADLTEFAKVTSLFTLDNVSAALGDGLSTINTTKDAPYTKMLNELTLADGMAAASKLAGRSFDSGSTGYYQVYLVAIADDGKTIGVSTASRLNIKDNETTSNAMKGAGDFTIYNAATIPEPTSGLLLLLGVAGLALRRRRA